MRISAVLKFDEYYRDPRFAKKKARDGSWKSRCGDNIYYQAKIGRFVQALAFHHNNLKDRKKDLRNPGARVFISDYFFYFGENADVIPKKFASLVRKGRGCEYHEGKAVDEFVKWLKGAYGLEGKYGWGLHGLPRDRDEGTGEDCGSPKSRNRQEKQDAAPNRRGC
jgi:hypothetical protein